jgi:flagellar motility protein MotE (MotC chaperone)
MFKQKTSLFLLLFGTIILCTITFSFFPSQSESGDVYSYTDEKGVIVVTNTPLPEKIRNKAKKVGSYKDITDEDRKRWEKEKEDAMQAWRDSQTTDDERRKKRIEAEEKARIEAEIPEKLRKSEAETGKFVKSVKEAKDRAVEVLNTLEPLKTLP